MAYLITDALGPYFKSILVDDINQSNGYTISFDETTNSKSKKELQVRIRYFSEMRNEIVDSHLETCFLGKATGKILPENLILIIEKSNFPLEKLIMLASDGPNVNKTVLGIINSKVFDIRQKGLLNMGTCNLHVPYNAFVQSL